eukprot:3941644-Rhodomonas_salina.13
MPSRTRRCADRLGTRASRASTKRRPSVRSSAPTRRGFCASPRTGRTASTTQVSCGGVGRRACRKHPDDCTCES